MLVGILFATLTRKKAVFTTLSAGVSSPFFETHRYHLYRYHIIYIILYRLYSYVSCLLGNLGITVIFRLLKLRVIRGIPLENCKITSVGHFKCLTCTPLWKGQKPLPAYRL